MSHQRLVESMFFWILIAVLLGFAAGIATHTYLAYGAPKLQQLEQALGGAR